MSHTIQDILTSLQTRQSDSRWGIGTALQHMKEVKSCFGGGICPVKSFSLVDSSLWEKELTNAAERLTFCDELTAKAPLEFADAAAIKAISAADAIGVFDCVLTTKSRDRDFDIVEPSGLNVDGNMPLLWQHIQLQPIGKMVSVIGRDDSQIRVKAAIANTELGRDAAILAKFGALRISHAFRAKDFAPIELVKLQDGRQVAKGWHIKAADCFEMSLVSIPANSDAVITAYTEKSLESPLVKRFAENLLAKHQAEKPATVRGFSPERDSGEVTLEIAGKNSTAVFDPIAGRWRDAATKKFVAKAEVEGVESASQAAPATKAVGQPTETLTEKRVPVDSLSTKDATCAMESPHLEGSWEWVEHKLWRSAVDHFRKATKDANGRSAEYVRLIATFPDSAIVCTETYNGNGYSRRCFKSGWKMDGGKPMWDGEPAEVEIKAQVIEKSLQDRSELSLKSFQPETPEQIANRLIAKSVFAGRDGLKALRMAADAAVDLARHMEEQELNELFSL